MLPKDFSGSYYIYACFQGRVGTVKSELAGSNLMSACLRQWEQQKWVWYVYRVWFHDLEDANFYILNIIFSS